MTDGELNARTTRTNWFVACTRDLRKTILSYNFLLRMNVIHEGAKPVIQSWTDSLCLTTEEINFLFKHVTRIHIRPFLLIYVSVMAQRLQLKNEKIFFCLFGNIFINETCPLIEQKRYPYTVKRFGVVDDANVQISHIVTSSWTSGIHQVETGLRQDCAQERVCWIQLGKKVRQV